MKIYHGFDHLPPIRRAAVAVGSFDGVHRGHRLLIGELDRQARRHKGESVIVTFEPHPRTVLRGENRLLTTLPEKLELLKETPVRHVIVVRFTPEFSRIGSRQFAEEYLMERLGAAVVLSGDKHHFGHDRSGDLSLLKEEGIATHQLDRYENISSTAIRQAIEAGDIETANAMLGAPYLILTEPYDPTKLLPPDGEYTVLLDDAPEPVRMRIDPGIFGGPARRIRIVGK